MKELDILMEEKKFRIVKEEFGVNSYVTKNKKIDLIVVAYNKGGVHCRNVFEFDLGVSYLEKLTRIEKFLKEGV